ncbi:MAG: FIST N-terminal domain-containing protein [Anaerolineae bacterium]|nr:FIST N-terminal domain-containing protein [Anaerolineae bacterium]MDK1080835.1 FIST N-terminal domain-containing protein [Anaerolineae bacterium]MDK1117399.1 FIST N-terminal domain-containing protein [Anaerolineae bacterium]
MTLQAAVGQAQALDGREASLQATHQALNRLGAVTPGMGIVIASHQYQPQDVASGVSSLLGDTPLIGFSAPAGVTGEGLHSHSVVVAVLSAEELDASSHWLPGYAQSSREIASQLERLISGQQAKNVIFFADGFNGDAEQFCHSLTPSGYQIAGILSSGDLHTGNTYQIAGNQTGTGALSALTFKGNLRMGVGYAHGWDPVGNLMRVTRSRGFWLRTLNAGPASETYAEMFGYPAREWAFPPLSQMARLYPLGIEQGDELVVRSPIRVEADGSFRMNAPVRDGADAFILVGSRTSCHKAAQEATQQALRELDGAKPAFALVLIDIAWQMLLKATPGVEIQAIQEIIGKQVPIAGGYSLGQIVPGKDAGTPEFLNQHIVVILFGDATKK